MKKTKLSSYIEEPFKVSASRLLLCSAVFSLLLSLSFVLGGKIAVHAAVPFAAFEPKDIYHWLLYGLIIFLLAVPVLGLIGRYARAPVGKKTGKKTWLLASAVLIICWIPYFLIFYPGNLSNDSFSSLYQIIGKVPLNNHHPVMFTLFVGAVYKLGLLFGDRNFAVACLSAVQMLILAAILGFNVYWFAGKGVRPILLILIVLFFALNPVIAMYSITMWKDVLFGGWMLLLTMFLFDAVQSGGRLLISGKGIALTVALSLLVSFGRNNGVYIVFAVFAVLAVVYRAYFKRLLPVFFGLLAAILLIQGPLYSALKIGKSPFAESVAIPLQQLGYTEKFGGEITPEQEAFLNQILPRDVMTAAYVPYSDDRIKFDPEFDNAFLENNKAAFLKTWFEILAKNPTRYLKAYLMETQGYYHIGTSDWINQSGITPNKAGFYSTNLLGSIIHADLPARIASGIDDNRSLYSIAVMVWLCFLGCMASIVKRNAQSIAAMAPLLALWATIMIAAPFYCEYRYMFSFLLAVPFLIFTLLTKPADSGEKIT